MNLSKLTYFAALCIFISACSNTSDAPIEVNVIPLPVSMEVGTEYFKIPNDSYVPELKLDTEFMPENTEAYELTVDKNGCVVTASSETGYFYGLQTFAQLKDNGRVPFINIQDYPRFKYRGFMLDVARNFSTKEEVLKIIDQLAYYKFNKFHLHLTDGGGWRIQIDKYPKLTSETAFRDADALQDWIKGDRKFKKEGEEGGYGGYYTKDDIREIVAYAASKHITVIPEIEMPGHSETPLVAYPEYSCSGKPYVNGDYCIGNEETFVFLQDILDEVIELFPSEYIHVGGDEAGKSAWKTCPKCKKRMKDNKLKDIDELQSYMIQRIEKHLISRGRKLIGWDEIIEGGLAPEATVMSWRGEEGAITAAKDGHDAIMTPSRAMYFDFYQSNPHTQPEAIGGYIPLKTVYNYNPIPKDLPAELAHHIIGAQANLWAEYISTPEHVEYMIFPRLLAVSEMTWTPQEKRNWLDFKRRANANIPILQKRGINAFTLSDDIDMSMEVDTVGKEIKVILDAEKYPALIRYTTDGSTPTVDSPEYTDAIVVKDSAHIVAAIFKNGELQGTPTHKKFDYHRAINAKITYNSKLYKGYMAGGMNALLDGYRGGLTYLDNLWQGYTNSLDCVIDMGSISDITKVSTRYMQLRGPGVYLPKDVEVFISDDGKSFKSIGKIITTSTEGRPEPLFDEYTFNGKWSARYIQLKANIEQGFIFLDEIVVW